MMEIRKRRPFHDEDAMSAMNDIMFFLMLFFLIIATMSNANIIKIRLPLHLGLGHPENHPAYSPKRAAQKMADAGVVDIEEVDALYEGLRRSHRVRTEDRTVRIGGNKFDAVITSARQNITNAVVVNIGYAHAPLANSGNRIETASAPR